jgi:hypothetical protein
LYSCKYLSQKKASIRKYWLLFNTIKEQILNLPYYLGCTGAPSAGLAEPPAASTGAAAGAEALSTAGAGAGAVTASVGAGAGSFFEQAARPRNAVATAIVVNIFISLFSPCVFFTFILIQ